ncbi:MAG: hypothetical protein ABW208_01735 [Pyrinomonadaceae bacterium]
MKSIAVYLLIVSLFGGAPRQTPTESASLVRPPKIKPRPKPEPTEGERATAPARAGAAHKPAAGTGKPALTYGEMRARVATARRVLRARATSPQTAAFAFYEPSKSELHYVSLPKSLLSQRDAEATLTTAAGASVSLRVARANGVNTTVTAMLNSRRPLIPLLLKYPLSAVNDEQEVVYYTPAHPALNTAAIAQRGKKYLANLLADAAGSLREKGFDIPASIVKEAHVLCLIEHLDPSRLHRESLESLVQEVYVLLACNEGDTFLLAGSRAGAFGLVQMIAKTYHGLRRLHPRAGLLPDFVGGMRNHANALEAMLLYLQHTWGELSRNSDMRAALDEGLLTRSELLAAGYNSNPYKLPGYLRRGGRDWRTLLPAETQNYLKLRKSIDRSLRDGRS